MAEESVIPTEYGRFSLTRFRNITINLCMIVVWRSLFSLSLCFAHILFLIYITDSLYPGRH